MLGDDGETSDDGESDGGSSDNDGLDELAVHNADEPGLDGLDLDDEGEGEEWVDDPLGLDAELDPLGDGLGADGDVPPGFEHVLRDGDDADSEAESCVCSVARVCRSVS